MVLTLINCVKRPRSPWRATISDESYKNLENTKKLYHITTEHYSQCMGMLLRIYTILIRNVPCLHLWLYAFPHRPICTQPYGITSVSSMISWRVTTTLSMRSNCLFNFARHYLVTITQILLVYYTILGYCKWSSNVWMMPQYPFVKPWVSAVSPHLAASMTVTWSKRWWNSPRFIVIRVIYLGQWILPKKFLLFKPLLPNMMKLPGWKKLEQHYALAVNSTTVLGTYKPL